MKINGKELQPGNEHDLSVGERDAAVLLLLGGRVTFLQALDMALSLSLVLSLSLSLSPFSDSPLPAC